MNPKLEKQILKAGREAHAKITKAWIASFFPTENKKWKKQLEQKSLRVNQATLALYILKMSDEQGTELLRIINNQPFEMARKLKDVRAILLPEQRGRQPILSDNDRRNACSTFDAFRRDGHTRKSAIEKTVKQFDGITPQQMEGILRHRSRFGDV